MCTVILSRMNCHRYKLPVTHNNLRQLKYCSLQRPISMKDIGKVHNKYIRTLQSKHNILEVLEACLLPMANIYRYDHANVCRLMFCLCVLCRNASYITHLNCVCKTSKLLSSVFTFVCMQVRMRRVVDCQTAISRSRKRLF